MTTYRVPWRLRPQPATKTSPATPEQLVEVILPEDAYELAKKLRTVRDDGTLPGQERDQARDELHVLFEAHFFLTSRDPDLPG